MQLELKTINKILSNLESTYSVGLKKLSTENTVIQIGDHNGWEASQGSYNESNAYYSHPELPDNIFLKVTYRTDSYGSGESVYAISFVEGKEKTITVYEPI